MPTCGANHFLNASPEMRAGVQKNCLRKVRTVKPLKGCDTDTPSRAGLAPGRSNGSLRLVLFRKRSGINARAWNPADSSAAIRSVRQTRGWGQSRTTNSLGSSSRSSSATGSGRPTCRTDSANLPERWDSPPEIPPVWRQAGLQEVPTLRRRSGFTHAGSRSRCAREWQGFALADRPTARENVGRQ